MEMPKKHASGSFAVLESVIRSSRAARLIPERAASALRCRRRHKTRSASGKRMSAGQKRHAPAELWSLEQAANWIGEREHCQPLTHRRIQSAMKELHEALKLGKITVSGCVDGGERRTISPEEWHDYRMMRRHAIFPGHHKMGAQGVPLIKVLSSRSLPAGALKDHGHKSEVQVPSAQSTYGEQGYHREITGVLLSRDEVVHQWPARRGIPSPDDRALLPARSRPALERSQRVIDELYPDGVPDQATEPNPALCRRVSDRLQGRQIAASLRRHNFESRGPPQITQVQHCGVC